jgi:glycogen debranching enzyme
VHAAHELLMQFDDHIDEACVGSISEVFDAESPYTPRGCIAQAWSVAEVLRCLIKTSEKVPASPISVAVSESELVHAT